MARRSPAGGACFWQANELEQIPGLGPSLARIEHFQSGMIIGTVRILPLPDRRNDVLEVLRSVQGPVRAMPGCTACDVYEEQSPDAAVVFIERWESRETLDVHLRSEMYRRILSALELSSEAPEIRFEHVMASEGLEIVERTRGCEKPKTRFTGGQES